jgi:hypothetical protein
LLIPELPLIQAPGFLSQGDPFFRVCRRDFADMRSVVQILSEYHLTVFGVLDRLQDVRMPKLIHILAEKDVFGVVLVLHEHGQIVLVCLLDAFGVLATPAFSQFGVHHSELDGLEIEGLYRSNNLFNGVVRQFRMHGLPPVNFI